MTAVNENEEQLTHYGVNPHVALKRAGPTHGLPIQLRCSQRPPIVEHPPLIHGWCFQFSITDRKLIQVPPNNSLLGVHLAALAPRRPAPVPDPETSLLLVILLRWSHPPPSLIHQWISEGLCPTRALLAHDWHERPQATRAQARSTTERRQRWGCFLASKSHSSDNGLQAALTQRKIIPGPWSPAERHLTATDCGLALAHLSPEKVLRHCNRWVKPCDKIKSSVNTMTSQGDRVQDGLISEMQKAIAMAEKRISGRRDNRFCWFWLVPLFSYGSVVGEEVMLRWGKETGWDGVAKINLI